MLISGAWGDRDGAQSVPDAGEILRIPEDGGDAEHVLTLPPDMGAAVDMTPDGRRIACFISRTESDIWLVENFDPDVN